MSGEDDPGPRSVDPETARRLRELFATPPALSYERPRAVLVALVFVPALCIASQPLPWHHEIIPGAPYQVVYGYTHNLWVLVVGAIALGCAVRVALRPVTTFFVVGLVLLATLTVAALYSDWANAYSNAGAQNMDVYNGPGFYVALAAAVTLIAASGLAWHARATSSSS